MLRKLPFINGECKNFKYVLAWIFLLVFTSSRLNLCVWPVINCSARLIVSYIGLVDRNPRFFRSKTNKTVNIGQITIQYLIFLE